MQIMRPTTVYKLGGYLTKFNVVLIMKNIKGLLDRSINDNRFKAADSPCIFLFQQLASNTDLKGKKYPQMKILISTTKSFILGKLKEVAQICQ